MVAYLVISILGGAAAGGAAWLAQSNGVVPALEAGQLTAWLAGVTAALALFGVGAALAHRRLVRQVAALEDLLDRQDQTFSTRIVALQAEVAALARPVASAPAAEPLAATTAGTVSASATGAPRLRPPSLLSQNLAPAPGSGNVVQLETAARQRGMGDRRLRLGQPEIEQALAANAIEAFFQPIVALPERKTAYLEAVPHLMRAGEEPLAAEHWRAALQSGGAGAQVDRLMLVACVRLARELRREGRDCRVLWPLTRQVLATESVWNEASGMLKANSALCDRIVCELPAADYSQLSQTEIGRLHQIREFGFKLGLGVGGDGWDATATLATGLFAMVRADAAALARQEPSGVHMADAIRAAGRSAAPEIAAVGLASEEHAMALIDREVLLVQGPLIAPARPLKRGAAQAPGGAAG